MNETIIKIKEIFAPSVLKVALTVVFAVVAHIYFVQESLRHSTAEHLEGAQGFWLSNFVNALPFLETENTALKFLTFFLLSYAVVWIGTALYHAFDNLQLAAVKKFRRKS